MSGNCYEKKHVLITGGAGFLGSNLAHALRAQNATVTVVDNFHPDYGGNEFNFTGLMGSTGFNLEKGNVTNQKLVCELAAEVDFVFHLAAQCSHVDSMSNPLLDLDFNCRGTLAVLEAVRLSPRKPVYVYAGTRAIIGAPLQLPATESTLPNPVDIYGVNKLAAEHYGSVYARVYRVPVVSLRITNCFGPRHQMKSGKYGILNWFVSLALQGKPIKVFGTGEQLRDYLFVDDAIEAFLKAGRFGLQLKGQEVTCPKAQLAGTKNPFAVFNVGSGKGIPFVSIAQKIAEKAGSKLEQVAWPADRESIETGDFISDGTTTQAGLGWCASTSLDQGLEKTFAFYREHLKKYL
ncbi:MAG: NAD-dependent epimerase/dehydratase family protein [Deltaproteobacteria bacterium]|nr:NAD-dependent epimerase/dehydratase family protein [Deltaproteobacteria bacterium]